MLTVKISRKRNAARSPAPAIGVGSAGPAEAHYRQGRAHLRRSSFESLAAPELVAAGRARIGCKVFHVRDEARDQLPGSF